MSLKPELVRRVARFAVVGATVMAVFTALNWCFGRWFGATTAFLLAYPPAVALHFALNRWWTFGYEGSDLGRQVGEYLLMVAVTFVVQFGLFRVAHDVLGWPGWLAAGAANAGQMVLSFLLMQRRVFAPNAAPASPSAGGTGWLVALVLLASLGLRWVLAARGGQLFWADEQIRYGSAQTAYDALLAGEWAGAAREILGHADHPLFRLWSLPGAALQHHGFGSHAWAAASGSLFSVAVLALVWALARRVGAGPREALVALVLAAGSNALLFYSRHLLPYDMALAWMLAGLWCGLGARVRGMFAAGALVGVGFLTYTGYWLLGGVLLGVAVFAVPGGLGARVRRAAAGFAGLLLPLGLWLLAGWIGDYGLVAKIREFSGSVTQGDFGDGHRVLAGYLWSTEGILVVLWLVAAALGLRASAGPGARGRTILWLAVAGLVAAGLVGLADVARQFVVYGRLVRGVVPFLCLAAAVGLTALPLPARPLALVAALALTALNFAGPLSQRFPEDFRRLAWAELERRGEGTAGVVRVVRTERLPMPEWRVPLPAHEVLLRRPHPLGFRPYRYEGFTRVQRSELERLDLDMRLIRLDVSGAGARPEPAAEGRWGAHPGPLRLSFRLPPDRVGLTEPLLVSGSPRRADFLFLHYIAPDRVRVGFDHWGAGLLLSAPLAVDPAAVQTLVVSTGPLFPAAGLASPDDENVAAALRGRLVVTFNGEPVFSRPAPFHPSRPDRLQFGTNLLGGSSCGPAFTGQILAVERVPVESLATLVPELAELGARREPEWAGAPGPFEVRLDLSAMAPGEAEPVVGFSTAEGGAVLLAERLADGRVRLGYERFGGDLVWSQALPIRGDAWQRLEVSVGGLMPAPGAPLYSRVPALARLREVVHVRMDGVPVMTKVLPDPGPVRTIALGWNGVRSSVARARLSANIAEIRPLAAADVLARSVALAGVAGRTEAGWGGWPGGVRLRLRFPTDRARQAEPLLVRGVPGAGDILFVHYLDGNQVRIGLDHWGSGGPVSPPVTIRPGAEHELVVLADLLLPPGPAADGAPPVLPALRGVLRVAIDGELVLAGAVSAHAAEVDSLTLGANFIGGSTAGPVFTGQVLDVAPLSDVELLEWARRAP